jgi:hypothetical protein
MPSAAEAVLTFLESVGRRSEAELYLRLFQKLPKQSFAIVAPANTALRQGLGTLVEQLRFLADLGLSAPIVLGLFHPGGAAAIEPRLVRRLESAALSPLPLSSSESELEAQLRDELGKGKTPIVRFVDDGADVAVRFQALARIAAGLATRKLVLVRRHGGLELAGERYERRARAHLLDVDRGAVSLVNLRTDAEPLLGQKLLRREDGELLEHVRSLLGAVKPHVLLVSVTSPFSLLTELFTQKGAGTLIKPGSAIRRLVSYADAELARLRVLLETSFGRELAPEFFGRPPLALFLEEEYRGAALVQPSEVAPYLSKFAVEPVAQGEGIGRDLWRATAREFPRLFWRTRADNPSTSWYFSVCDGMVRRSDWSVFWRGIEPELVPQLVEAALAVRDDFMRGPS